MNKEITACNHCIDITCVDTQTPEGVERTTEGAEIKKRDFDIKDCKLRLIKRRSVELPESWPR